VTPPCSGEDNEFTCLSLIDAPAEREPGLVDGLGCLVVVLSAEEAQQVPALALVGACEYKNRE
jgi:hypothetical protein